MQALNRRNENCRRSGQVEQATDCIQKQKRLRCCGRVFSEQESVLTESGDNQTKVIGQGKRKGNRQLNNMENAQGRGLGNGQGRRKGNTQGQPMGNGQGEVSGQGRRMGNGQGEVSGQGRRMGNGEGGRNAQSQN